MPGRSALVGRVRFEHQQGLGIGAIGQRENRTIENAGSRFGIAEEGAGERPQLDAALHGRPLVPSKAALELFHLRQPTCRFLGRRVHILECPQVEAGLFGGPAQIGLALSSDPLRG